MAAGDKDTVKALVNFTGLEPETVSSQILPYLQSISTRSELESHLQGLLGGGSDQNAFIRTYVDRQFSPKPPASDAKGRDRSPTSAPASRHEDPRSTDLAGLSATFGAGGSLYVKNRDEALFAGSGGGKKGKGARTGGGSTPVSGSSTPALVGSGRASPVKTPALATPPEVTTARQPSPSSTANASDSRSASPALAPVTIPLSATAASHLSRLDTILASLSSPTSKTPTSPNPCHCRTRLHPSPLPPLPSLCPNCALPLCSLTPPLGPCPSCTHYPLMSSGLVESVKAHFATEREAFVEREKRIAAEKAKREKEDAQRERFPELGGNSGRGSPSQAPRGYSTSAGGGPSLENRIAQGYARMQAEGKAKKEAEEAARKAKEGPRTVLRLTKDGKAKVVTTTPAAASSSSRNGGKGKGAKVDERPKGWVDENDDGWRRQKGLQPLLSVPSTLGPAATSDDQSGKVVGNPRRQLRYVPPRTYETEGASETAER